MLRTNCLGSGFCIRIRLLTVHFRERGLESGGRSFHKAEVDQESQGDPWNGSGEQGEARRKHSFFLDWFGSEQRREAAAIC